MNEKAKENPSKYKRILVTSESLLEEAQEYLTDLGDRPRLAIDTETAGKLKYPSKIKPALRHDNILLGVSISKDEHSGIYIPYFIDPEYRTFWSKDQLLNIREWLKTLFLDETIGWVMHNSLYDARVLKRNIRRPLNIVFDTQIAAHELNENRSLGLKDLGQEYFGGDAKEEFTAMKEWCRANPEVFGKADPGKDTIMGNMYKLPLNIYGNYAIKDTMLTFALYKKMARELQTAGLVKRYKQRHALIPVYEEINSTGWTLDSQILKDNGKIMVSEIAVYRKNLYNLLEASIQQSENELLNKEYPITQSPVWKKRLLRAEGLEKHFTVDGTQRYWKNGNPRVIPKNAGQVVTSKLYVDKFIADSKNSKYLLYEFLTWDGIDPRRLSDHLTSELNTIRKNIVLKNKRKTAEERGNIPETTVFNFSSGAQLANVLHNILGLECTKRSMKTNEPVISKVTIPRIQTALLQALGVDLEWRNVQDLEGKAKYLEKKFNVGLGRIAVRNSLSVAKFEHVKCIMFLENLLLLADREKIYSTYVVGILDRIYTHKDLRREPQISSKSGRVLDYVVSSVSLTGTKTGRPASNSPNQLNFPNNNKIKEAFVVPVGYKLGSADYDAQEVRQATNIALDKDMKDVFTIKCQTCQEVQTSEVRIRLVLDVYKSLTKGCIDDSIKCRCGAFDWSAPDPHSLNVRRIYPNTVINWEENGVQKTSTPSNMSLQLIKKHASKNRDMGKIVLFLTLYGGLPISLAEKLFGGVTKDLVDKAEKIQKSFFAGAHAIHKAILDSQKVAIKQGYVETIGGYKRYLKDLKLVKSRWVDPPDMSNDPIIMANKCFGQVDFNPEVDEKGNKKSLGYMECPKKDDLNACQFATRCDASFIRRNTNRLINRAKRQTFNAKIQGGCADIMNRAMYNLAIHRKRLAKINPLWNELLIISQIYDALYLLVPEGLVPKDPVNDPEEINYLKVMRHSMENTYPNLFVQLTVELEPPAEAWSECH